MCLFYFTISLKTHSVYSYMKKGGKNQILTFVKPEQANIWHFCLKYNNNNNNNFDSYSAFTWISPVNWSYNLKSLFFFMV